MSPRALMIVEQPCVLCEGPLQLWTLMLDDETGQEVWTIEDLGHRCQDMKALMKEYGRP